MSNLPSPNSSIKREVVETEDGSKTIHLPTINESYHSTHGAVQEAKHVFIKSGFDEIKKKSFSVLEIGFGTGLNSIITFIEGKKKGKTINYTGLEAFPISKEEMNELGYFKLDEFSNYKEVYLNLHSTDWEKPVQISDEFSLLKIHQPLIDFSPESASFDLIYFDAFGPDIQPEMWTVEVFKKMYESLKSEGILVTYSAKGQVRRNMLSVGFEVEKIPGPPGKREMLRARK